jgi:hypothetical protein
MKILAAFELRIGVCLIFRSARSFQDLAEKKVEVSVTHRQKSGGEAAPEFASAGK